MSKKSIILSAAGLKNIVHNKEKEEEFIFKIGEKELKMNKISAEFISPRVSHIHQCDPTINLLNLSENFNFNNDNKKKANTKKINEIYEELFNENYLSEIKNLSEGNMIEIEIEKENEQLMKSILYFSILVNNEELYNKIDEIYHTKNSNNKKETNIKKILEEVEF